MGDALLPVLLQPRNPHDDRLVLNKHSSIYPTDDEVGRLQLLTFAICYLYLLLVYPLLLFLLLVVFMFPCFCPQMKAVNAVVADVEKTLKILSDDLMAEECQRYRLAFPYNNYY